MASRYVVTVLFRVKPEHRYAFREAILANATSSVANEPGCQMFDVCESATEPEFFLYEQYDNEAAFQVHCKTPHFLTFDAVSAPWTVDKKFAFYNTVKATSPHKHN